MNDHTIDAPRYLMANTSQKEEEKPNIPVEDFMFTGEMVFFPFELKDYGPSSGLTPIAENTFVMKKCECGGSSVNAGHSTWCQLFEEFK